MCVRTGDTPACSCQPGYIGSPPNCRPECTISAECPAALACVAQRCKDPCEHACGPGAVCSVVDHRATCACEVGLQGDPFQGCARSQGKVYFIMYLVINFNRRLKSTTFIQEYFLLCKVIKMNCIEEFISIKNFRYYFTFVNIAKIIAKNCAYNHQLCKA